MSRTRKKLIIDTDPGIGEQTASQYQNVPRILYVQE